MKFHYLFGTSTEVINPIIISVAAGLGIFLLVAIMFLTVYLSRNQRKKRRLSLAILGHVDKKETIEAGTEPRAGYQRDQRHLLLIEKLVPERYEQFLKLRLIRAGYFDKSKFVNLITWKLVFAVLAFVLYISLNPITFGIDLFYFFSIVVLASLIPDIYVINLGTRRDEEIQHDLPEVLDLLYIAVSAGLGLNAALEKLSQSQKGPAADELIRVFNEMRLGASRFEAFSDLARRTKQRDLRSFAEVLVKVDELGVPLKNLFEEQSLLIRAKRVEAARGRAQRVQVKLLGPIVLCFLPAILILIISPAAVSIFSIFR